MTEHDSDDLGWSVRFDNWLSEKLGDSDRWVVANPVAVILFLAFCYWVGHR